MGMRLAMMWAIVLSLVLPARASASTIVIVPPGTRVPLEFVSRVDSRTAREGTRVRFTVAADVVVNRLVVIQRGAVARGLITSVVPPGIFGRAARVHIAFIDVTAVDHRPVRLGPVDITPAALRESKDVGGALAAGAAGLILLGPVGVAASALVRGGHVEIPAGAVAITAVTASARVRVS